MSKKEEKGKLSFMKFVSQVMAIVLVLATVLAVSPKVTEAEEAPPVTAITYVSAAVYDDNYRVEVAFDAPAIKVDNAVNLYQNVLIKRSGSPLFVPLKNDDVDDVFISNGKLIIYFYDIPVTGSTNEIKILANTLRKTDGGNNVETIFSLGALKDVTAPQFKSSSISANYKTVTLTFDENLVDYSQYNNTLSLRRVASLKQNIALSRNGTNDENFKGLSENDTVTIDQDKLIIVFEQALTGDNNVIKINSNALSDIVGNVINTILTNTIKASGPVPDTKAPSKEDIYFANNNHDIVIEFNENIATSDTLKNVTHVKSYDYISGYYLPVSAYGAETTTVTINGKNLVIHFDQELPYNRYQIYLDSSVIADTTGNVYESDILWYDYPHNGEAPAYNRSQIWNNYKYLTLLFNNGNLVDNTVDNGISSLKNHIWISRSNGVYTSIGQSDNVIIRNDRLVILFSEPQQTNFKIKIDGNSLKNKNGVVLTGDIELNQEVETRGPELQGNIYTNVSSEILFDDNESWRTRITSVTLREASYGCNWITRVLSKEEYQVYSGRIVINAGTFKADSTEVSLSIYAEGYGPTELNNTTAFNSTDSYYLTAPILTIDHGLTATVKVLSNDNHAGDVNSSVIFQLKKGDTPVSIVSLNAPLEDGTYTANFNVSTPNLDDYTVQAFLVNRYSNDPNTLGVNLAKVVTQTEFDLIKFDKGNNRSN
jgi:hypothetical protein